MKNELKPLDKYKWIFFDADNTLFQFNDFNALTILFSQYNVNFTKEDFEAYQKINKPLWVEYQNGNITALELQNSRFKLWAEKLKVSTEILNNHFLKIMAETCPPLEGAESLLHSLKKANVKIGIITNGFIALHQKRLEFTRFSVYIDLLVVSEAAGIAKPDRRIFDYAINQIDNPPESNQILMVGDTAESDILGGINAKWDTCWLNTDKKPISQHITPTYQVSSLMELENFLLGHQNTFDSTGNSAIWHKRVEPTIAASIDNNVPVTTQNSRL